MWVKLVDTDQPAPPDPGALTFLTMTTKPSSRAEFKSGEGGKAAVCVAVVGSHCGDGGGVKKDGIQDSQ